MWYNVFNTEKEVEVETMRCPECGDSIGEDEIDCPLCDANIFGDQEELDQTFTEGKEAQMLFIGKMTGWSGVLKDRLVVVSDQDIREENRNKICEGEEEFIKNPNGGYSLCRIVAILPGEIVDKITAYP